LVFPNPPLALAMGQPQPLRAPLGAPLHVGEVLAQDTARLDTDTDTDVDQGDGEDGCQYFNWFAMRTELEFAPARNGMSFADIAAGFLVLWIVLYLLEANQGNVFVGFVHGMADFLAGWSQDIFTMETEGLRVLLNFGLPAVIYLLIGHGAAARLRRV
jgi:hypothetical protein